MLAKSIPKKKEKPTIKLKSYNNSRHFDHRQTYLTINRILAFDIRVEKRRSRVFATKPISSESQEQPEQREQNKDADHELKKIKGISIIPMRMS